MAAKKKTPAKKKAPARKVASNTNKQKDKDGFGVGMSMVTGRRRAGTKRKKVGKTS